MKNADDWSPVEKPIHAAMTESTPMPIELAFRRLRQELEIRSGFPAEVIEAAERVARERNPVADSKRVDRTDIPFVTIDPPGSRDLDQAIHIERSGDGYLLRYAIADVGFWVDRGSAIEREAWLRGVTFYAPDHREPLYPPVLSAGVASLLPETTCPAVLFTLELNTSAELQTSRVERALVRSRVQLTYSQLLQHVELGGASAADPWRDTLTLLGEIGPKRVALEAGRGGVSLPVRDQQVYRRTAAALGYELVFERPSESEKWNAQISLLTGHVAATRMLEAKVGLLRTMEPIADRDVEKFRRIASTLGFAWPPGQSYGEFMHTLDPHHPRIEVLVRQARRVIRGADYVSFSGTAPEQPLHGALAFTYAHATAPLRRLGDRYVLDLLITLASGAVPSDAEMATLNALPEVMNTADARTSALERRVVDIVEAWELKGREGEKLSAVVVDVRRDELEVQIEDPPIRATLELDSAPSPPLGARIQIRLVAAEPESGSIRFELVG